ncbi:MAG TPA: P-type conjugative transfer protein TrbL [Asticcacaulis sp.]|nr:P-type conjugative transfer protein TrbL [Asticcacaulis sp.]
MQDLNVIDHFLTTFSQYLDSGFGLLKGDVGRLSQMLITLDVTLATLFWLLDEEARLLGRLIKKILFVGAFAYIINNFQMLANIVYASFSGLGLQASNNSLNAADLLLPGKIAGTGFTAAKPLLDQLANLMGLDGFFSNLLVIIILLLAWLIVILAFFVLAIQLFITILEFKLTTLAGFVLTPFALWNKTAFLAERVLGNVITSGVKTMVMAVIVGIGVSLFGQYQASLNGQPPDLVEALTLVLASLTLLGLGIFGPSISAGLVSGAPQLGAGAAFGTVGAAVAAGMVAGGAVVGGARLLMGGGSGFGAVKAASSVSGQNAGSGSGGGTPPTGGGSADGATTRSGSTGGDEANPPAWAKRYQRDQQARTRLLMLQNSLSAGDHRGGSGANPSLSEGG